VNPGHPALVDVSSDGLVRLAYTSAYAFRRAFGRPAVARQTPSDVRQGVPPLFMCGKERRRMLLSRGALLCLRRVRAAAFAERAAVR
jgi:hypothetical protein